MGAHLSVGQIERLVWIRSKVGFSRIVLFLDRDEAGRKGACQAEDRLSRHNFDVNIFDWDRIRAMAKDPADLSVEQLQRLHGQGCF